MSIFAFPKSERLLKRPDFLSFAESGRKIHTPHFLIIHKAAGVGSVRIGITVSRKVGNSVIRNRLKRYVREFYRQNKPLFIDAQYNIIAKRGADLLDFHHVARELVVALERMPK